MKKYLIIGAVLGVVALTLGIVGFAYAQPQNPAEPVYLKYGSGYIDGVERGGRGRGLMEGCCSGEEGLIHEYMITALADAFKLTPDELEARHDAGDTLWDIAQELGYTAEDFRALVQEARAVALRQAVADGIISQEQANWMLDHMNQGWENGYGPGSENCDGTGQQTHGRRGRGSNNAQSNP